MGVHWCAASKKRARKLTPEARPASYHVFLKLVCSGSLLWLRGRGAGVFLGSWSVQGEGSRAWTMVGVVDVVVPRTFILRSQTFSLAQLR